MESSQENHLLYKVNVNEISGKCLISIEGIKIEIKKKKIMKIRKIIKLKKCARPHLACKHP
jgi:hypothetical protein